MSTSEKKRGKLSREEEEIILNSLSSMSDEMIAEIINRNPETVAKFRAQAPVVATNQDATALIAQLHKKFFWEETKSHLASEAEITFFERYWASLVSQFAQQGILPTDELMMRDLIVTEVNINRCLRSKRNIIRELENIEQQQEDVYAKYPNPEDALSRLPLRNFNDEWKLLQDKKDKKLDQLKATRQSRLEKTEKAGRSFIDMVKMLDSPEVREREGRLNELHKAAGELAKLRFEQIIKFENEQMDRVFLTPEAEEKDANT